MQKCGMTPLSKRETITYRGRTHNCIFYAARRREAEERED